MEEKIFFTSDTHYFHNAIVDLAHRPFKDGNEMTEELIKRWNAKVGENDTVYHLGDFAFGGANAWKSILDRLNGKIHLIMGNHDLKNLKNSIRYKFEEVTMQKYIYIGDTAIYLNHFPFLCYGGDERGVWQLYGHVHSGPRTHGKDTHLLQYLGENTYDVGVDNNNFEPVTFEEILAKKNGNDNGNS